MAGTAGIVVLLLVAVELDTVAGGVGTVAAAAAAAGGIAGTLCLGSIRLGRNMTMQLVLGFAPRGLAVAVAGPGSNRREAVLTRPRPKIAVEAG